MSHSATSPDETRIFNFSPRRPGAETGAQSTGNRRFDKDEDRAGRDSCRDRLAGRRKTGPAWSRSPSVAVGGHFFGLKPIGTPFGGPPDWSGTSCGGFGRLIGVVASTWPTLGRATRGDSVESGSVTRREDRSASPPVAIGASWCVHRAAVLGFASHGDPLRAPPDVGTHQLLRFVAAPREGLLLPRLRSR